MRLAKSHQNLKEILSLPKVRCGSSPCYTEFLPNFGYFAEKCKFVMKIQDEVIFPWLIKQ